MFVEPVQYEAAFDRIVASSISHAVCKVCLFVSALDIDALCAAQLLAKLLKRHLVVHKIVPVVGYKELKASYQAIDEDVTNVFLVGCGATVDIEKYLGIVPEDGSAYEAKHNIYIIDNHRPWSLDNLYGSKGVWCMGDNFAGFEEAKTAYEWLERYDATELEREERMRAKEEARRTREAAASGEDTDNDIEINDDDDDDDFAPMEAARELHESAMSAYYGQGTFVDTSSSIQIYTLLSQIGETTVDGLWLTIVGVTSLDAQYPNVYRQLFPLLKDEVNRLQGNAQGSSQNAGADGTFLLLQPDYALFLLRHWSLYESIMHSSYMTAQLQLWNDDGRKKLHKMLARMGVALQEARETWTHMNMSIKKQLRIKFDKVSELYGIEHIVRQGVLRRFGYKGSLSAGDCVEALTALLADYQEQRMVFDDTKNNENSTNAIDEGQRQAIWVSNFWKGWDGLSSLNVLLKGVERAKKIRSALAITGGLLLEQNNIKDLRNFRLAVVKDGDNLDLFQNPLILAHLGVWLSECSIEIWERPMPLVVAALAENGKSYLVLGMAKPTESETDSLDETTNRFGAAFQKTAADINARVRMDAFESSIIEVAKEDLYPFLEALALLSRSNFVNG